MSLECGDCLERLYPYLDRELSPADLGEVRKHLDHCAGCDELFVLERVFLEQVRDHATSEVCPQGVRDRLVMRLRSGAPPPS